MAERQFVDFASIKERVGMNEAIQMLGLKLTKQEGDQLRFPCPACDRGDPRALSINAGKGVFRCFEDRGKGGTDSIALVAHCKGIRQREAAVMLDEHFPDRAVSMPTSPAKAELGHRRESGLVLSHRAIEALGLSAVAIEGLGGGYSEQERRVLIPLRLADGTLVGHLGIATSASQSPLLLFPHDLEEKVAAPKPAADELRKLFRVVNS